MGKMARTIAVSDAQYCVRCGLCLDPEKAAETVQQDLFMQELTEVFKDPATRQKFLKFIDSLEE